MKKYVRGNIDDDRLTKIFKEVDAALESGDVGTTWDYDDLNVYLTTVSPDKEIVEYKIPLKDILEDDLSIEDAAEYILEELEIE